MAKMSSAPEFLICLDCETPCYDFEWEDGKVGEVICHVCGNDEADEFITEEEFEALSGG
jgi:hypothetical protein